jgi:hypothetical protein
MLGFDAGCRVTGVCGLVVCGSTVGSDSPVVPPELIDADNRDRNHPCGFCHDLIFIDATIWSAPCFEITVEEEERHQWDACNFIFNQRLPRVRT